MPSGNWTVPAGSFRKNGSGGGPYGTTVIADQSPLIGNSNTEVSKGISGLTPNMTYHYQVIGLNSAGTTYWNDLTLTTFMPSFYYLYLPIILK